MGGAIYMYKVICGISVIYQYSTDLHLWPVTCVLYLPHRSLHLAAHVCILSILTWRTSFGPNVMNSIHVNASLFPVASGGSNYDLFRARLPSLRSNTVDYRGITWLVTSFGLKPCVCTREGCWYTMYLAASLLHFRMSLWNSDHIVT